MPETDSDPTPLSRIELLRLAQSLGVSDADRESAAAKFVDRALILGPGPAARSYLDAKLVVQAAKASGFPHRQAPQQNPSNRVNSSSPQENSPQNCDSPPPRRELRGTVSTSRIVFLRRNG